MYDIDRFSYWNDPIVKIKRRGIYPLNDEGRAQYYSKDSFVHHYLRRPIPKIESDWPINEGKNDSNEEQKETISPEETKNTLNNLTTVIPNKEDYSKTILNTEPNLGPIKLKSPSNLKNNIISNTIENNLNKRYELMSHKKKLKLKKIGGVQSKSLSKDRNVRNLLFFGKTIDKINKRNVGQSFEKKAGLTGLKIFPNRTARINPELPRIMQKFRKENNIIKIIKTETKEMGESYNPYNFIVPHVNRTKRNIFGSLFHS